MEGRQPFDSGVEIYDMGNATIFSTNAYREQLKAVGCSVEEVPEQLLDLLQQDEWWRPQEGPPVRIENMTRSHRRNLIRWLERRATQLHLRDGLRFALIAGSPIGPGGDMACDAFDAMVHEEQSKDPLDWLNDTPLMKKLRKWSA